MAVDPVFSRLSARKTTKSIRMTCVKTSHVTVFNWIEVHFNLMNKFMYDITPQVGEEWKTNKLYLKIMGNRRYLLAMLDSKTRYWLAKMAAKHRGNDDVAPMFEATKKLASKVQGKLVSDGTTNLGHARRKQYAAKNFLHKDSEHARHIRMASDTNNGQMESFNGNAVRLREEVTRGLKTEDAAILTGLRLYYNCVRPHLGLNGKTPAEAAGIRIEGDNKWKTIIQAAAKAEAAI